MRLLSLFAVAGLILSPPSFAEENAKPNQKLNALMVKLMDKDDTVRKTAISELTKTEGADLKETLRVLLIAQSQGMYLSNGESGYKFQDCSSYRYGGYYPNYYSGYYFSQYPAFDYRQYGCGYWGQSEIDRLSLKNSKEAAKISIVAMGAKAIEPLISLYGEKENSLILTNLEEIAEFQQYGPDETKAERLSARHQVYTFIGETYLNKAKALK